MKSQVEVGSFLIENRPGMTRTLGIESEPYSGNWNLVLFRNGRDLDNTVRSRGWNSFFMAGELRTKFFGAVSENDVRKALMRIIARKSEQNFNCLEVTGITAKHFLGVAYTVVTAHSRHIQHGWLLDGLGQRRTEQNDAEPIRAHQN